VDISKKLLPSRGILGLHLINLLSCFKAFIIDNMNKE
jgi:hypothetical protein